MRVTTALLSAAAVATAIPLVDEESGSTVTSTETRRDSGVYFPVDYSNTNNRATTYEGLPKIGLGTSGTGLSYPHSQAAIMAWNVEGADPVYLKSGLGLRVTFGNESHNYDEFNNITLKTWKQIVEDGDPTPTKEDPLLVKCYYSWVHGPNYNFLRYAVEFGPLNKNTTENKNTWVSLKDNKRLDYDQNNPGGEFQITDRISVDDWQMLEFENAVLVISNMTDKNGGNSPLVWADTYHQVSHSFKQSEQHSTANVSPSAYGGFNITMDLGYQVGHATVKTQGIWKPEDAYKTVMQNAISDVTIGLPLKYVKDDGSQADGCWNVDDKA